MFNTMLNVADIAPVAAAATQQASASADLSVEIKEQIECVAEKFLPGQYRRRERQIYALYRNGADLHRRGEYCRNVRNEAAHQGFERHYRACLDEYMPHRGCNHEKARLFRLL